MGVDWIYVGSIAFCILISVVFEYVLAGVLLIFILFVVGLVIC